MNQLAGAPPSPSVPIAPVEVGELTPATAPVEVAGLRRDQVRLLVARRGTGELAHTTFEHLGEHLDAGDVVVVNTSATLPAAVPAGDDLLVHLSTELPGGSWVVELRRPCRAGSLPATDGWSGRVIALPAGGRVELLAPFPATAPVPVRLWTAALEVPAPVPAYLASVGRPIRYGCPERAWPLPAYQTVFARHPGSAEMPSAGRAFTPEVVTDLVTRGVVVAPVVLHTGVSSQERWEPPYPERYRVPAETADLVNDAHRRGRRVVAVGTTVTRALESAADAAGAVHPSEGWTELVVTPQRGVRVVDGLVTGWHEPAASHLQLLEAVAGRPLVERSYAAASAEGYRGHELGDLHLVLP